MNNELNLIGNDNIKDLILTVREKQVMLDSDIANLYEVETKRINEAVKRNQERFPKEFCFRLTELEYNSLRSQIATLKNAGKGQHRKYLPYVFTEQGVAMLSAVIHNNRAIKVSINIMKAFVEMKKFIINNQLMFNRISNIELKQLEYQRVSDEKFEKIFNYIDKNKEIKQKIFFQGQIWDSYSLIIDIIRKANSKILIIDNYIDDSILGMLKKKNENVEVVILTSERSNISKLDIQKFNKQYPVLKVATTNKFHDRFIFIDNKELYHLRSLNKRLG